VEARQDVSTARIADRQDCENISFSPTCLGEPEGLEMKHRIVHMLQKYVLNRQIKLALAIGLPLPGYALLETTGRNTGKPRRTPVG